MFIAFELFFPELSLTNLWIRIWFAEYVHKTKATMQLDWADDTLGIVNTDTGERIPAYLFVTALRNRRFFSFL